MAHHDALTSLPNRLLFRERMETALARLTGPGDSLAVLCIDLDHFKDVNDTLGHPAGDALLRAVAGRLRNCIRDCDVVARLGGDAVRHPADFGGSARRSGEPGATDRGEPGADLRC